MIRVLAKALSEVMNRSSMALSKSHTFSCWSTEPRIPTEILVLMNITLSRLDRNISSTTFINDCRWSLFPYSIVYIHPPQLQKNYLLPYLIVISFEFENITLNIRKTNSLRSCKIQRLMSKFEAY